MKFLLPLLAFFYFICPYDFFPDLFIGWGWLDDLLIVGLVWWWYSGYKKKRYGFQGAYEDSSKSRDTDSRQTGHEKGQAENASSGYGANTTRSDPYTVLGLKKDASREEIRQAYRRLVNKYHPDKVNYLGEEFRQLAEKRFKEIQEAYQELSTK